MRQRKERILVVDDMPEILRLSKEILSDAGFGVATAASGEQALELVAQDFFDLMILDERMPGLSGAEVLAQAKCVHPDLAVIIVTGYADVGLAVRVFREGANDLLTKPVSPDQLIAAVHSALASSRLSREVRYLRSLGRQEGPFGGLLGQSDRLVSLLRTAEKALHSDVPVLITGETGTGKELLARGLHDGGPRSSGPFVVVDLNRVPEGLRESELFGHVKGAFTGANEHKAGKFQIACGGTIFLDEIGEISGSTQVKLLRVLQEKSVQRLGATKEVDLDVRVVAATNKNLKNAVQAGNFREDLYYRLAVFPIHMPPLRDRKDDVPLLALHFLDRCSSEAGKKIDGISDEVLDTMVRYDWPGNIRELQNVIQRAVLLTDGDLLRPAAIPGLGPQEMGGSLPPGWTEMTLDELRTWIEKAYLQQLLSETGGNTEQACRRGGIHRTTLARKMKKYAIETPRSQ